MLLTGTFSRAIDEKLRVATEAAKHRRGVRVVDYGEGGLPVG